MAGHIHCIGIAATKLELILQLNVMESRVMERGKEEMVVVGVGIVTRREKERVEVLVLSLRQRVRDSVLGSEVQCKLQMLCAHYLSTPSPRQRDLAATRDELCLHVDKGELPAHGLFGVTVH